MTTNPTQALLPTAWRVKAAAGPSAPQLPRKRAEGPGQPLRPVPLRLPYPENEVEAEEQVLDALGASFDGHPACGRGDSVRAEASRGAARPPSPSATP